MNPTGNTILITGGGSGIGLALALEFKRLGNKVIVAGRNQRKLDEARGRGLETLTADMGDGSSVCELAASAIRQWPALNVVIHNAGIMINEKLTTQNNAKTATETIAINLLGPILLTTALLPHFLKQTSAVVMTVTSGLAYVPLAMTPTYSASKSGVHAYTESLRYQLQGTSVEVKELIPPYVRTSLMGGRQAQDSNAMPLEDFVSEVFTILREDPSANEIAVTRVQPQRTVGFEGKTKYEAFFKKQNDTLMEGRKNEWSAL